jgi:L-fuculose-phosphate aldolase
MTAIRSESMLRRALCDAGRALYDRELIAPLDGNLSARLGEAYLLCTPSGTHKGELRPEALVKTTLDGRVVGSGRPSSELKMHLGIYAARPSVRCIVHAHPPCAVGLTVAGISLDAPVVPEILFVLGRVPTVPYASPTTGDVPEAVAAVIQSCDAFILARHGTVVLCDDPRDGVIRTEVIEHTAKITLAARIAGGATPLPAAEVEKLLGLAGRGVDAALVESIAGAVLKRLRG